MSGNRDRPDNLIPMKKGDPTKNPKGHNQWTYRREAQRDLDAMLAEKDVNGNTRSQAIIDRVMTDAENGKPWALRLLLDRILPVTTKHEHEVAVEPRSFKYIPTEADQLAVRDELEGKPKRELKPSTITLKTLLEEKLN